MSLGFDESTRNDGMRVAARVLAEPQHRLRIPWPAMVEDGKGCSFASIMSVARCVDLTPAVAACESDPGRLCRERLRKCRQLETLAWARQLVAGASSASDALNGAD